MTSLLIQSPKGKILNFDGENILWIILNVFEFNAIFLSATSLPQRGKNVCTFKFMSPNSLIERFGHVWEEYESIYTRALKSMQKIQTSVDKFKSFKGNLGTNLNSTKTFVDPNSYLKSVKNINIPQTRIDSPLTYQSSERRSYDLNFNFFDESENKDISPYEDVVKPIKLLEQYSCPGFLEDDIRIKLPHIFEISTYSENGDGNNLIKIDYAVLKSIQATYNGPYRKGQPTNSSVSLQFVDLQPVYKHSVENYPVSVS